jgi:hypothetical protein
VRGNLGWAVALVALGAATRLGAATWLGGSFHFLDETIYVDAARRLLAGEGFGADYANVPAYPVVLAVLATPWPGDLMALRAAQAVVTAAGVVLVLVLGGRTIGPWPARVAGCLYALDPLMVVAGGLLYAEAVAAVVLLGVLLAAWSALRGGVAWSAVAGLLLGVLAQLRPVALVLVPVVALWIAASARRARVVHVLAVGGCCLAALAPWTVRNYRVHGGLVPISATGTQGAPVAPDEVARRGLAASIALHMWEDPAGAARRMGRELAHFWALYPTRLSTDNAEQRQALHEADTRLPTEASFPLGLRDLASALTFGAELTLALGGMVLAWRRQPALVVLLVAVSVTYGLGYAVFIAKLRYRIVVLPCVFLLAGVGVVELWRVVTGRGPHRA